MLRFVRGSNRRRAAEAALRTGDQRWIGRGASRGQTTAVRSRKSPTLARRFPVVPGTRPYPLVPPLPVLESLTGPPPFRDTNIIGTRSRRGPRKSAPPVVEHDELRRQKGNRGWRPFSRARYIRRGGRQQERTLSSRPLSSGTVTLTRVGSLCLACEHAAKSLACERALSATTTAPIASFPRASANRRS